MKSITACTLLLLLVTFCYCDDALPYSLLTAPPIPEKFSTAETDGTYLYVATFSDPVRIIKYKLSDMSRVATIDFAPSQNVAFATKMCVDMKKTSLFIFAFSNLGTAQYGGSNEVVGGAGLFGPARIIKIDLATFTVSLISTPPMRDLSTYRLDKLFADTNYIYLIVDGVEMHRLAQSNLGAVGIPLQLGGGTFIRLYTDKSTGALSTDKVVIFGYRNVVAKVQLRTWTLDVYDVTLSRDGLDNYQIVSNYLYASRTYTTANNEQQVQVVKWNIDNNYSEVAAFDIGSKQPITANAATKYSVSFAYDQNQSTKIFALYYSYTTTADGTITSEKTLYSISVSTNTITNNKFTFPNTQSAVPGFAASTPFFLVYNNYAYYGSYNNNIYRVSLSSTGASITHSLSLQSDGIGLAQGMTTRGNTLFYSTSKIIGQYNLQTNLLKTAVLTVTQNGLDDPVFPQLVYIDDAGQYAQYVSKYSLRMIDLNTSSIMYSYGVPNYATPYAVAKIGSYARFFYYNPGKFGAWAPTLYLYGLFLTTQSLDVTSLGLGTELHCAAFDATNQNVYFAAPTSTGNKIFKWNISTNQVTFVISTGTVQHNSITIFNTNIYATSIDDFNNQATLHWYTTSGNNDGYIPGRGRSGTSNFIINSAGTYGYWSYDGVINRINLTSGPAAVTTRITRAGTGCLTFDSTGRLLFAGLPYVTNSPPSKYLRVVSNIGVINQ
jgi:hypothetical protein